MYTRAFLPKAQKSLGYFPVLAILGPRQCGKTTLAKELMKGYAESVYLDLLERIVCPIDESYPYKNGTVIGGVRQIIQYINGLK